MTTILFWVTALVAPAASSQAGPRDATVLIIRHAEKPDEGPGLAPAGEARAKDYVQYFQTFRFHSAPVKVDAIFATADSNKSCRPRLTVEPLSRALGLPANTTYKDKEYPALAADLDAHYTGKNVLVCWHHGALPEFLLALGADPKTVLPGGVWPPEQYRWMLVLRFDADGKLREAQRIEERF